MAESTWIRAEKSQAQAVERGEPMIDEAYPDAFQCTPNVRRLSATVPRPLAAPAAPGKSGLRRFASFYRWDVHYRLRSLCDYDMFRGRKAEG